MTKDEVRALARRLGLPNADKPDSQEICFIPDGDHAAFVDARGGAGPAGAIVDDADRGAASARTTARTPSPSASGAGLPGGAGERRFVLRIDAATGEVRVGPRDAPGPRSAAGRRRPLAGPRGRGRRPSLRGADPPPRAAGAGLDRTGRGGGRAGPPRRSPPTASRPGQAAVFYDGDDRVLGGGWIAG